MRRNGIRSGQVVTVDQDLWSDITDYAQNVNKDTHWIATRCKSNYYKKDHFWLLGLNSGLPLKCSKEIVLSTTGEEKAMRVCPVYREWLKVDTFMDAARRAKKRAERKAVKS